MDQTFYVWNVILASCQNASRCSLKLIKMSRLQGWKPAEQHPALRHLIQILASDLFKASFQGPDEVLREALSLKPWPSLDPVLLAFCY